jgi:hypothetical protein
MKHIWNRDIIKRIKKSNNIKINENNKIDNMNNDNTIDIDNTFGNLRKVCDQCNKVVMVRNNINMCWQLNKSCAGILIPSDTIKEYILDNDKEEIINNNNNKEYTLDNDKVDIYNNDKEYTLDNDKDDNKYCNRCSRYNSVFTVKIECTECPVFIERYNKNKHNDINKDDTNIKENKTVITENQLSDNRKDQSIITGTTSYICKYCYRIKEQHKIKKCIECNNNICTNCIKSDNTNIKKCCRTSSVVFGISNNKAIEYSYKCKSCNIYTKSPSNCNKCNLPICNECGFTKYNCTINTCLKEFKDDFFNEAIKKSTTEFNNQTVDIIKVCTVCHELSIGSSNNICNEKGCNGKLKLLEDDKPLCSVCNKESSNTKCDICNFSYCLNCYSEKDHEECNKVLYEIYKVKPISNELVSNINCNICHQLKHDGITCIDQARLNHNMELYKQLASKQNIELIKCINCHNYMEKTDKITSTCYICNTVICWKCNSIVTREKDHINKYHNNIIY